LRSALCSRCFRQCALCSVLQPNNKNPCKTCILQEGGSFTSCYRMIHCSIVKLCVTCVCVCACFNMSMCIHISLSLSIYIYTYFPPGEKEHHLQKCLGKEYVTSQEGNVLKACESMFCSNSKCISKVDIPTWSRYFALPAWRVGVEAVVGIARANLHPGRLTFWTYRSPVKRKEKGIFQPNLQWIMFQPFIFTVFFPKLRLAIGTKMKRTCSSQLDAKISSFLVCCGMFRSCWVVGERSPGCMDVYGVFPMLLGCPKKLVNGW